MRTCSWIRRDLLDAERGGTARGATRPRTTSRPRAATPRSGRSVSSRTFASVDVIARRRDAAVEVEAERLLPDPPRRDERLHRQVDPELLLLGKRLALHLGDRLRQDPAVRVEPDRRDVPVLLRAEQVAGAADLQVAERDLEAAAERLVLADRGQPFVRLVGQLARRREEEVAERPLGGAPDAPAQLVHLRQAQQVRGVDDQRVRVRHVQPLSMITLQTSTSASRSQNFIICFSRSSSSIWPCATTTRASGSSSCSHAACRSIVATRLWTQKTWPSRRSSRRTAPSASPSS